MLVVKSDEGNVCICVYLSCLPADQGRIEKCIWGGS